MRRGEETVREEVLSLVGKNMHGDCEIAEMNQAVKNSMACWCDSARINWFDFGFIRAQYS